MDFINGNHRVRGKEDKRTQMTQIPLFYYMLQSVPEDVFSWQISIVPKKQRIKCPQSELICPLCPSTSLLWEACLTALYKSPSCITSHLTNKTCMVHVRVSTRVCAALANVHWIMLGVGTMLNDWFPTCVWRKQLRFEEMIFPRLVCKFQSSV